MMMWVQVMRGEVALAAAAMATTYDRLQVVDFSDALDIHPYGFMYKRPSSVSKELLLTNPFEPVVWLGVVWEGWAERLLARQEGAGGGEAGLEASSCAVTSVVTASKTMVAALGIGLRGANALVCANKRERMAARAMDLFILGISKRLDNFYFLTPHVTN